MCGGPVDEEKNGQGQQNNFIFNHTAPINLNFYEEVKNKTNNPELDKKNIIQANNSFSGEAEIEVKAEKSAEEAQEVIQKSPNKK